MSLSEDQAGYFLRGGLLFSGPSWGARSGLSGIICIRTGLAIAFLSPFIWAMGKDHHSAAPRHQVMCRSTPAENRRVGLSGFYWVECEDSVCQTAARDVFGYGGVLRPHPSIHPSYVQGGTWSFPFC